MTIKEFKSLEKSLLLYRDRYLKPGPKDCKPCYHHEGSHRGHRTYQRSVCATIDDVIHLLADRVKRKKP
jgi:hypothetical protein